MHDDATKKHLVAYLEKQGMPRTAAEICEALKCSRNNSAVQNCIRAMLINGELREERENGVPSFSLRGEPVETDANQEPERVVIQRELELIRKPKIDRERVNTIRIIAESLQHEAPASSRFLSTLADDLT